MGMRKFLEKPGSKEGKAEKVAHSVKMKQKNWDDMKPQKKSTGKKKSRKRA